MIKPLNGQIHSSSSLLAGAAEPPPLDTARLRLVPPEPSHASGLFSYGCKSEFTIHLDASPFQSLEEAASFAQSLREDNHSGRRLYWVAKKISDNTVVGTLGFILPFAKHHRVAEFGYGFDPATWGTGLFQEAAQAVLTHGFGQLGFHRIQALTKAANLRSINGVRKLGFQTEATLADFYQDHDGGRSDAVLLAILRPAFNVSRGMTGMVPQSQAEPQP